MPNKDKVSVFAKLVKNGCIIVAYLRLWLRSMVQAFLLFSFCLEKEERHRKPNTQAKREVFVGLWSNIPQYRNKSKHEHNKSKSLQIPRSAYVCKISTFCFAFNFLHSFDLFKKKKKLKQTKKQKNQHRQVHCTAGRSSGGKLQGTETARMRERKKEK